MQQPKQLTEEEILILKPYVFPWVKEKSKNDIVFEPTMTTGKRPFTWLDHCQLAYTIWQRFGKNDMDFTDAWQRLMQNNCRVYEAMRLVAFHIWYTWHPEEFEHLDLNKEI